MCSSPWGAFVALCWIYSTMSVTLCPVPLNTVLRCSFRSCTEQRSPIPWPADSTLASADHTDHTQLSSLPQGLPACSCSALLWALQVSFLQSSFLAICPQPAGLYVVLFRFEILTACFFSSLLRCPWVAALSSRISTALPNLGLSVKLLGVHSVPVLRSLMEIGRLWRILSSIGMSLRE